MNGQVHRRAYGAVREAACAMEATLRYTLPSTKNHAGALAAGLELFSFREDLAFRTVPVGEPSRYEGGDYMTEHGLSQGCSNTTACTRCVPEDKPSQILRIKIVHSDLFACLFQSSKRIPLEY